MATGGQPPHAPGRLLRFVRWLAGWYRRPVPYHEHPASRDYAFDLMRHGPLPEPVSPAVGNYTTNTVDVQQDQTGITFAKPGGTVAGDRLIMFVYSVCDSCPRSKALSPPAGWTTVVQVDNFNGEGSLGCYTKIAGGAEPATYTVGFVGALLGQTSSTCGGIVRLHRAGTIDASSVGANTLTAPSITTTAATDLVLWFGGVADQTPPTDAAITLPAGEEVVWPSPSPAVGQTTMVLSSEYPTVAGPTGTRVGSFTGVGAVRPGCILVAVKP